MKLCNVDCLIGQSLTVIVPKELLEDAGIYKKNFSFEIIERTDDIAIKLTGDDK